MIPILINKIKKRDDDKTKFNNVLILSNKDSSIYLAKIIGPKTKKILLTHLSHQNNTEEKALSTIKEIFEEYEIQFTDIKCAKQRERSELIEI